MKKKAVSYLLCAAMVFSMAACGNDSGNGDSSQQDSSVEESSEESTEESSEESTEESSEETPADGEEAEGEGEDAGDEQAEEPVAEGPMSVKVEAESFELGGEGVAADGDHLSGVNGKTWAMYNVDLADGGYGQITIKYGEDSVGGTVRLWIGDEDYEEFGTMAGEAEFDASGEVTFGVPGLSGQNGSMGPVGLVLEWEGEGENLMTPDYFELYKVSDAASTVNTWKFFDNEFAEGAGLRGEPATHIFVNGGSTVGYKVNFGDAQTEGENAGKGKYADLKITGDFLGECEFEVHLDAPDGQLLGTVSFTGTEDWNDEIIQTNTKKFEMPELANVTGTHNVYFVIKSGDYNWASYRFTEPVSIGNDDAKTLNEGYNTLAVLRDSVTVTEGFEGFANEGAVNLFDDDTYTKYCCGIGSAEEDATAEITFSLSAPAAISGYSVYTANDNASYPDRNPKGWALYGKDASGEWVEIETSGAEDMGMEDTNYTAYGRFVEGAAEYTEYKFTITHNGTMQISELILFGTAK